MVRNELVSKPMNPIPNQKAEVRETRERFSHNANRAGKPANNGNAPVDKDAMIKAALAKGTLRSNPRTALKRMVSA